MARTPDSPRKVPVDLLAPGLPGEPRGDPTAIPSEYWRAFSIVTFTMNRFIIDHLIRAARLFDNDPEVLVLFGMLSHLNVVHLLHPGARPSTDLNDKGSVPDSQPRLRPVMLRDLAQITGRPRETVRRKLGKLEASGHVLRVPDGYVLNVDSVDSAMRELSMDSVRRFQQAAQVITAVLQDAERKLHASGTQS